MRALKTHCKISQVREKQRTSIIPELHVLPVSEAIPSFSSSRILIFYIKKKKNHKMLTYQSPKSPEVKLTEFTKALKPFSTHSASQYQYQNHYF